MTTVIPTEAGNLDGNPNAASSPDETTLIIGVAAGIGALFLIVLILFVVFVLYFYKKGDPDGDEEIYYNSRATSRAGSRRGSRAGSRAGSRRGSIAGSMAGSRRASIIRSTSLRNSFHSDKVFLPGARSSGSECSKSSSDTSSSSHQYPASHQLVYGSFDNFNRQNSYNERFPLMSSMRQKKHHPSPRSFHNLQRRMEAKTNKMSTAHASINNYELGDLDIRGSTNRGFQSEYEDLDRDLWHASKGGRGTVTQNPAFEKDDDDFNPIDVNLEGFDKGLGADQEDVDSGMAEETSNKNETQTDSNKESGQIQILDMTTWGSPPSSPNGITQPTPFTISQQISKEHDDNNKMDTEINLDFSQANPLKGTSSTSDINSASMKRRNQSVVDFYENANPRILGYKMEFPADAYGTGRRLLWQKKNFDEQ